jgi:ribosomal protein S18 acetylase RimI-like enzyme
VIQYRTFRNPDPPGLVEVWNASFAGRGTVPVRQAGLLEHFLFAKLYFDPAGLIVACDGDRIVGFAHAGFGPTAGLDALDPSVGVVCAVGVLPSHRRQGIGAELLRRAESYLTARGARELRAGPLAPANPFLFGLYGGAQSPGFLESNGAARPFFERHGYTLQQTRLVFQRDLLSVQIPADARFPALRPRFEIVVSPYKVGQWWRECVLGPLELFDFVLHERDTGRGLALANVWEMETFSNHWNRHAVGLADLVVLPEARQQGLAKFLLAQILRHLHEQYFAVVEAHTADDNTPAINLLRGLGFAPVDAGHAFRKPAGGP